jgi:hypothetical protein
MVIDTVSRQRLLEIRTHLQDGTSLNAVVPTPTEDEQTIRQSAGLPIGDERPAIGSLAQTLRP